MSDTEEHLSIPQAIVELLYEQECVIVPGFGGFVRQRRPADFDYVQGRITPPSSLVTFNQNLMLDDGLLVEAYRIGNGCDLPTARRRVGAYAEWCRACLARKEEVLVPGLGRLVMGYEQEVKFTAEDNNFNTESFGLPILHFHPIVRTAPAVVPPLRDVGRIPRPKPTISKTTRQRLGWAAVGMVALLLCVPIIMFMTSNTGGMDTGAANANLIDEDTAISQPVSNNEGLGEDNIPPKLNEKPSISDPSTEGMNEDDLEGADLADEGDDGTDTGEADDWNEDATADETFPKAEEEFRIIRVGAYRQQKGVDVMASKIMDHGWIPHVQQTPSGLNKVNVKVGMDEDIHAILKEVRAKLSKSALIIER